MNGDPSAAAARRPVWWTAASPKQAGTVESLAPRCDLLVVGGGILGLSAALHAAERGLAVQLVEAGTIGAGASGVNGGQVIPGLKFDPEALIGRFGPERGERLVRFAESTADVVFELIGRFGLDVPVIRRGWIQAAHTQTALATAADRVRQWRARGADVDLLDRAAIGRLTGARGYLGGWIDRRAGTIDPLAYTTGLARAAQAAGVRIIEGRRVAGLRRAGPSWLATLDGSPATEATTVLVATNAATDGLLPGLARTVVPLHSLQIATAPLPRDLGADILPEGQAVSDSRRILTYFRRTPDGRLMLGGRGPMRRPRGDGDWAHLVRALLRLYPALRGVPIERRWYGQVAVTADHLPHLHEPEPGLLAALGCQGRGVGLMTALGRKLAAYVAEGDEAHLPLPLTPIRPIPFHGLRRLGVGAAIAWYRARDAIER